MFFEFATAQRIIFGRGTVRELSALAAEFGQRVLLVTGSAGSIGSEICRQLLQFLRRAA